MGYFELFDAFFGIYTAVNCIYKPTSGKNARQSLYAVQTENLYRPAIEKNRRESLNEETNKLCVELNDGFKSVRKSRRSKCNKMPNRNTNCFAMDVMVTEGSLLTSMRQKRPITADVTVDVKTNLSDPSIAYYDVAESETSCDTFHQSYENEYPQFELESMQLETHDEAKFKEKSRSVLRKFLRCLFPSKVANISHHCSMKIDDVTTLHVLRGDDESDSGTCDAVRAPRRRH